MQGRRTCGVRDRKHTEDYETCVRRTGIAWIEIITLCICSVNFMFPRRPTERHIHTFSTAERPLCVPYKRESECTKLYLLIRQKVGSDSGL